ncbi:MAG: hypothetical protein A2516_01680 [Alphaproteobacteria bacterium RIFOXYD12_FULL_60_8]|nr:MAG: hypothetical protein A2516_01680 [Alphaproteobacteria bacterium RIFOXYD12_FULL_60_8]
MRMMARLAHDALAPGQVAEDFLARCGWSGPRREDWDSARLLEGLTWLSQWDARREVNEMKTPLLVLAGRSDPIVPPAMSEAGFAGHRLIWAEGGHLLPWEAPTWCAARIRDFVESL